MKKRISVLGSSGSIGTQALEVIEKLGYTVPVLAVNSNIKLLAEQIKRFSPDIAVVFDSARAEQLSSEMADMPVKILSGMDGLCEAAQYEHTDMVLNSVVGMVGLKPTLCAIRAGKAVALANKETLVAGGELVMQAVKDNNTVLLPVDSEHSAIMQCLQGAPPNGGLERLILTASGGPFYGWTREQLNNVTPAQALQHPNWSMGPKITIDSATMMNKGLELIEASWLFSMPADRIDIVIQRESVVHSLIEYVDHSVIAQLGVPNMKIPIQYALTYPERTVCPVERLDLASYGTLSFSRPDEECFPCLSACKIAVGRGGLAPAAANGANEAANLLFREGHITFPKIGELVMEAVQRQEDAPCDSLDAILDADSRARAYVMQAAGR